MRRAQAPQNMDIGMVDDDEDPDTLHTEEQRDAAFKEITGEDRPGAAARRAAMDKTGPAGQAQDARETAALRQQQSVERDPERLYTEGQRDAAYRDITGEDRPSATARAERATKYKVPYGLPEWVAPQTRTLK
jgi:hypothetical protein